MNLSSCAFFRLVEESRGTCCGIILKCLRTSLSLLLLLYFQLFEVGFACFPIGVDRVEHLKKGFAMVGVPKVTEFVDDGVFDTQGRGFYQFGIEDDLSLIRQIPDPNYLKIVHSRD